MSATGPALVLGSTQDPAVVDARVAAAAGVDVVRRRSGGGAVLVGPGEAVWVDVFVPADDHRWHRDVGRATHWLGEAWASALARLGLHATVHRGRLVATEWSRLACFAGLGPGELLLGGKKVVGISQHRARAGALFQCAALLRWEPAALVGLLALDPAARARAAAALAGVAAPVAVSPECLVDALLASLSAA
ncbi:MAG: hypothetical protein ABR511_01240 [Acidimicrobiales bacterium]